MIERNVDMLSDRIYSIRQQYHYSQEKFAEILGVSEKMVQEWESGISLPNTEESTKTNDDFKKLLKKAGLSLNSD